MNKIIIQMDTREKQGKKDHILKYFDRHQIKVEKIKLDVGDYKIKGKDNVVIDLKQNIVEIADNFFCDSVRFEKECIRAKNNNIQLIFLVEEKVEERSKLLNWKCPKDINGKRFLNVSGKQIYNEMKKYVKLFGVKFRFCHKLSTGKTIIDLLLEETKRLEDNDTKI